MVFVALLVQADEGMAGRAGRVPTVMEAATAASTAASFGLSRYTNGDKAATAAVNAAASAVRHDAAAGSVLFLQQRYLESVQTQARTHAVLHLSFLQELANTVRLACPPEGRVPASLHPCRV